MADNLRETEEGAVAFAFASALVAGDFSRAYDMLGESVRQTTTAETLRTEYELMLSYAESQPTMMEVMAVNRDFAWMKPDDVATVYTAIYEDDFCEGVDVLLCRENSRIAIKEIIWGRP